VTEVHVIDNALVADRVTRLRDSSTPNHEFRRLLRDLSSILVYEAMRQAPLETVDLVTPMGPAVGARLQRLPVVVPVLRAGLGMLDAALGLLGDAEAAFVGLRRDERTLEASQYASTLPESLEGRDALILDPMLATGGSAVATIDILKRWGVRRIKYMGLIAAPEGVARLSTAHPDVPIHVAAVDRQLNEVGFIMPGLGDAGDRQFGT